MKTIELKNGIELPQLGLGTFDMSQEFLIQSVTCALENGYRLFDTAPYYRNDISLGKALKENFKYSRKDYSVCTKVDYIYSDTSFSVAKAFEDILKRMDMEYIDLYLIHWPYPDRYIKFWSEMEKLYDQKLVKAIGVCNFTPKHLGELSQNANIRPLVNQIELHPLFTQNDIVDYCENNEIAIMSYTPLARMNERLITHPVLLEMAEKYGKTVIQLILRWHIEHGYAVIPKAANEKHIIQNANIFDFSIQEDISHVDAINENFRVRFDPDDLSIY